MTGFLRNLVAAGAVSLFGLAPALAGTPVKFVLDWAVIGTHTPFAVALHDKLYEKRGLDVKIDRGYGSIDTISKIGNGLYDMGFADPNLLLEYNAKNPDAKVTMVFLISDGSQSALVARKASGIKTPKDLANKKIGGAAGDNTRKLAPVYGSIAGFDEKTINWVSVQPAIKETLLIRGDVDALSTLEPTTILGIKKLGGNPSDYISFRYSEYMPELMGTGIIASQKTIKEKPEVVRAFVAASMEGLKIALKDPKRAVSTLADLDALVDRENELARFEMGNEMAYANPKLKTEGLGYVSDERLKKCLDYVSKAVGVPIPSNLSDIYDERFLPPKKDRLL
jgi:NitT/TauT family transport system substrate-binding protein